MALYRCKARDGVVHVALDHTWRRERSLSAEDSVDDALCGYTNYMERVKEFVNCIACLGTCFAMDEPEFCLEVG